MAIDQFSIKAFVLRGSLSVNDTRKALCPKVSSDRLLPMAKQSLGRNLGTLMGDNPKQEAAPVSAGVRSLMQGHNPPAPAAPPPVVPKPVVPRWYLLAGDVLLVGLALMTLFKSPHPLSWQRELFCAALVIMAAVLAIIALLTPDGRTANPPNKP
jgi:hypothetical protein